jgi:hypothetical protein
MIQLAHSRAICQVSGPLKVLRAKLIPAARELRIAVLKRNCLTSLL